MSGGLGIMIAYRKVKGKQILDKSGPLLKRNTTHQNKGTIRCLVNASRGGPDSLSRELSRVPTPGIIQGATHEGSGDGVAICCGSMQQVYDCGIWPHLAMRSAM